MGKIDITYWLEEKNASATNDGMLGGRAWLSQRDLLTSRDFLKDQGFCPIDSDSIGDSAAKRQKTCLEFGAGIGRVTRGLLLGYFDRVDLVEPVQRFTDEFMKIYDTENLTGKGKVGKIFNLPLQLCFSGDISEQSSEILRYYSLISAQAPLIDCIWIQWVMGYVVEDNKLVEFLKGCRKLILGNGPDNGVIFVKENCCNSKSVSPNQPDLDSELDPADSSSTRSRSLFEHLFEQAGLCVIDSRPQRNFPQNLYPVWMWCLKPSLE